MGVRVLRDYRVQIKAKMQAKALVAFDSAEATILETAHALVPKRTGALDATIVSERLGPLHRRVSAGGGAVDYAGYVELGTSKHSAQPYMAPAAERGISQLVSDLKK